MHLWRAFSSWWFYVRYEILGILFFSSSFASGNPNYFYFFLSFPPLEFYVENIFIGYILILDGISLLNS
jgi:hypothetical protein